MKKLTKTVVITAAAFMVCGLLLTAAGAVMGGDVGKAFANQGVHFNLTFGSGSDKDAKEKSKDQGYGDRSSRSGGNGGSSRSDGYDGGGSNDGGYSRGYGSHDIDDFYRDFFGDDWDMFGDFFNDGMDGYDNGSGRSDDVVYF